MLDLEIREQVARYVEGTLEASELEDWLENESWDLEAEPARTLAADVLRLLAEYANEDWTDSELRAQLGALSRTYWFDHAPKQTRSGSVSGVIRQEAQQSATADRWRVAESV
jgi:hypothetical protein